MIIYFNSGQLGNQIFQYQFLKKIKSQNEIIITSKCEYFLIFEYLKKDYIFLNKYFRVLFRNIFKFLSKLKLISSIVQKKETINGESVFIDDYIINKGFFKTIKIVEGFYQSEKFIFEKPKIKKVYIEKKENFFRNIPPHMTKVFVHIRKGDYINWTILGQKNPSLPLAYYKSAIIQLEKDLENPFFIFLSNDNNYIEKEFYFLKNKIISKNEVGVDLAIMKSCNNAVISNSTLSWWGVYMMDKKENILGPKYWLGWQSHIWYPIGIKLNFVSYITVKD